MNIYATDPVVGYIYKPGAKTYEKGSEYNALYQINGLGLRDREYGAKTENIFRILLLGDSFSVSHGLSIEDSLSRQIEKMLKREAGLEKSQIKIEVINTAAGGYSPYNYLKAYQRWAPVFKPDAVIVGLSPDDYECDNENDRYLVENGEIVAVYKDGEKPKKSKSISIIKVRKWLSWNSEFYILMRNFFYYNDIMSRIFLWQNPGGVENDTQMNLYMKSQQDKIKQAWSKSFLFLEKLKKETVSDGVMMFLIPIPLKMEIDSGQFRQFLMSKKLSNEQIDLYQQLREISDFCKKESIQILDPRLAMKKQNDEVPCYFLLDGHWNAEGVRIATESLALQWGELGLPPLDESLSNLRR